MHSTTLVAFVGGLIDHAQPSQPSTFSDPTNFFDYNIHEFFPVSQKPSWSWGETAIFSSAHKLERLAGKQPKSEWDSVVNFPALDIHLAQWLRADEFHKFTC